MKTLLAVYFAIIGGALVASASEPAVVTLDITRAKALAITAIKEKHPETDPAGLQYTGLEINASTNDEVVLTVNYLLTGSDATEDVEMNGLLMSKTRQTRYVVEMDTLGHINDVSAGSSISVRSAGRTIPTKKAEEPGATPQVQR